MTFRLTFQRMLAPALLAPVIVTGACMVPEATPMVIAVQTDAGTDGGALDATTSSDGLPPAVDLSPSERQAVDADPVAAVWTEHWHEHTQVLKLASRDEHAVLYIDDDIDRAGARWVFPFVSAMWGYTKMTYGQPGAALLYVVLHEARFAGGHSASIFNPSHDYRNAIDYGGGASGYWQQMGYPEGIVSLAGGILESTSLGVEQVPSLGLTGGEFQRIYVYDTLKAIGMTAAADRALSGAISASTDFPRPGTYWFRDWYYPLWKGGGAAVFARYFQLLSRHFPRATRADGRGLRYARDMSWGEYVHFMSGAAGADLKATATTAFGWPPENEVQLQRARLDFPGLAYPGSASPGPVAQRVPAPATR